MWDVYTSSMKKWIIYLSLIGITLGYVWEFIILFCILTITGNLKNIFKRIYPKNILWLSVFLIIESTVIFYLHYDIKKFFEQVLLILSFFLLYRVYVERCFIDVGRFITCYLNFSLFMAIYAIITYCLSIRYGDRACIWSGEAGDLSLLLLPSIVFYLCERKWNYKLLIMGVAFVLASSAAGFFALIVVFLLRFVVKNKRMIWKLFWGVIIFLCFFIFFFKNFLDNGNHESETLIKYQESIEAAFFLNNTDFQDMEVFNASTYSLMTNMKVAIEAPSRIVGTGLGTHKDSYEKLNPGRYNTYRLYGLNKDDAYSLLLRIFSEFGITGLFFLFLFLKKNIDINNVGNIMALSYIINVCITGGHYTDHGRVLFFIWFFYSYRINFSSKI